MFNVSVSGIGSGETVLRAFRLVSRGCASRLVFLPCGDISDFGHVTTIIVMRTSTAVMTVWLRHRARGRQCHDGMMAAMTT